MAKLDEFSKTFVQKADYCGNDGDQRLEIQQLDGGGGPYWVLSTRRWAIDSIEDLVQILREAGVAETAET